jgi:hypothetical protein
LAEEAKSLARRQFGFSAAKRFREADMSKHRAGEQYCALYEHDHDLEVSASDLDRVFANIDLCFRNLSTQSELLARLRGARDYQSEIPLSFELDGVRVVAKLDLVCQDQAGKLTVVDWKVSESETSDYSKQLLVYALAIDRSQRWRSVSGIDLIEANLLRGEVRYHNLAVDHLHQAEDFVYRSTSQLKNLLAGGDYESLDLADLDVARSPNTCRYCNYAALCVKSLLSAGKAPEALTIQGMLL